MSREARSTASKSAAPPSRSARVTRRLTMTIWGMGGALRAVGEKKRQKQNVSLSV